VRLRRGEPAGASILFPCKLGEVERDGGGDEEFGRHTIRVDIPGRLPPEPGLTGGAVFNRTEKDFRPAVNLGRSQQVLPEKVSTDCGTHGGGVRDEDGTLTHVDNGTSVGEGAGEESLLSGGEADRVIEVVADLTEGGHANQLRASEGVGSNRVFPTVAHEARGNQPGSPLGVGVLDVQSAKIWMERRLGASRKELENLVAYSNAGGPTRGGSGWGGQEGA
jgi:hypothetical protein